MENRSQMVTFKADAALVLAMEGVANRSEFIRAAILAALDGVCPLCHGTGVMNPGQHKHWKNFRRTHEVERCDECNGNHLVCRADPEPEGER